MKHAADTASRGPQARSFAASLLLGVATLTIAIAGMKAIADIIGPVFMALVITITLHPIRLRLEQGRLPGWVTSVLMLAAAVLLLAGFAVVLIVSVAQLAALLPTYADQIREGVANVGNTLRGAGVKQGQIDAVTDALDPGQIIDVAMSVLSGTLGLLTDLFFLITVLLFIAFDTDSTRHSMKTLGGRFPDPVAALDNFARGTRSYMAVSASFGLVVAIIDGIALHLLDVPGAFVWAVLAFVTNFIPNIGFIIGVVPPALIALLDGSPGVMATVIVVYSVINFVIQSVVQPRVVGDSVGLSPTLTFLSLVFWTWVIGPVGALLAVPFSLLAKSLLVEADPRGTWALPLISGRPEPETEPPPEPEQAPPATIQPEGTSR
ncbi:AI-2E family transporter [Nocardioides albus]|uniref:Putative PurR-regulated permease PerM n=1 Tax=Nocardioides albus TaxID=1841 RepID=A0A7W5F772_9ACTN|nr:AI-2E family transporter [Nocardioides albus]MBB3087865.1 putative PurR-regulated permease PerM [Nocardioides albus]GGU20863.1 AI-2E family transporter [Nocardioides albus]